jgi:hypothetical protein
MDGVVNQLDVRVKRLATPANESKAPLPPPEPVDESLALAEAEDQHAGDKVASESEAEDGDAPENDE